jgi:hypothetical protein
VYLPSNLYGSTHPLGPLAKSSIAPFNACLEEVEALWCLHHGAHPPRFFVYVAVAKFSQIDEKLHLCL